MSSEGIAENLVEHAVNGFTDFPHILLNAFFEFLLFYQIMNLSYHHILIDFQNKRPTTTSNDGHT